MQLPFRKVEGLGNDFVVLDRRGTDHRSALGELASLQKQAPSVCDRRLGVGADGLLIIGPGGDGDEDATMWVINHDGSRPEMCGNGLRCVALLVAQSLDKDTLRIGTDAGPKGCEVDRSKQQVLVDMGAGVPGGPCTPAGQERTFDRVSMGNPHAVTFVEAHEDPERLAREHGPTLEVDAVFPDRTNVEFAQVRPDGSILLWVWERGCGITQACGTGACATACAAVWSGRLPADTPFPVDLPGGRLRITVPADRSAGVRMEGPARVVFEGSVALDEDAVHHRREVLARR